MAFSPSSVIPGTPCEVENPIEAGPADAFLNPRHCLAHAGAFPENKWTKENVTVGGQSYPANYAAMIDPNPLAYGNYVVLHIGLW